MTENSISAQASDEPMPCPFCEADNVSTSFASGGSWRAVYCVKCEAEGPPAADDKQAIAAWNRRSALKAQPAPTEACPLHEEIIREGDALVCTACGTTTAAPGDTQNELRAAAAAVVARWDSPKWKDELHTAMFIDRLRKALDAGAGSAPKTAETRMNSGAPASAGIVQPSGNTGELVQGEDSARLEYVQAFQSAITELVMHHIDRMNDICGEDNAVQIIESFVDGFDPLFEIYMAAKFPERAALMASKTRRPTAPQPQEKP